MTITPEQTKAVSEWVAAGDSLYAVQKKLSDQFKVSMTYMDVRFLVDDLNLHLKDPAPAADASDVGKGAPAAEKKGLLEKAKEKLGLGTGKAGAEADEEDMDASTPPSSVRVTVDKVTLNPNAMASGTVTFADGVTGKWIVDHQGRPGLMEVSRPGYRPSAADAQAFMQELSAALQSM
ncbi:MAG TPA: hypothetical protein VN775_01400 [Opitutaceae bacterium]|nr:hypothetical protein [Opitutaceae bacterium]